MQKKRLKIISEEGNEFKSLQKAIDEFLKFKTAQGMSELTMRDYNKAVGGTTNVPSGTKQVIGPYSAQIKTTLLRVVFI